MTVPAHYCLRGITIAAAICFLSVTAFAHPMGNFSISHYSAIQLEGERVELHYVIDMAEIPAFQEMQQGGFPPDPNSPVTRKYLSSEAELLKANLILSLDGHKLRLQTQSSTILFPAGAGGLPTMKVGIVYVAALDLPKDRKAKDTHLVFRDDNFPDQIGWKEVVATATAGIEILQSSVGRESRSAALSNYPTDQLASPPRVLSAEMVFRPELPATGTAGNAAIIGTPTRRKDSLKGPAAKPFAASSDDRASSPASQNALGSTTSSPARPNASVISPSSQPPPLEANRQGTPQSRFTQLMTAPSVGFWFLLVAASIALGLGALHALEPGHGKTIVAAYLVGSRGTARHAVVLGVVVTAAHTAGVFTLGLVTLYASHYIVPERIYPWLGAISGLCVTLVGVLLLVRHLSGETGEHSHTPGENHSHWFSTAALGKVSEANEPECSQPKPVSLRQLCILGITGGIVPCPAALVVLLSAFSLHRVGFGLFLITAFSVGLAAVLVSVGLLMVYARRFMSGIQFAGPFARRLPLISASVMVLLGLAIAWSALAPLSPTAANLLTRDKLVPFMTVVGLGLFLGMRHSTDPDHVVAVSTIVTRGGSVRHSAMIGLLWGCGHSLTIFLVGAAIIIFNVVIPPRLGLSMEFAVAIMLIILGLVNLSGAKQWIVQRIRKSRFGKEESLVRQFAVSGSFESVPAPDTHYQGLLNRTISRLGLFQTLRPFAVGLVHGLAGSAAVALLVLSTIKSPVWATAYLLVFGGGTMVGMMLMTTAISLPFAYTGKRFLKVNGYLMTISGVASVLFGTFLVYQIGMVDGLFLGQVHWVPQ
ncbi:MAG: sulfite exporter TauE/SafE family protein [Acidobacteriales bacterium]|nr:sulfite exporter TauE/SafE family protein [Terriglobales bacterium]